MAPKYSTEAEIRSRWGAAKVNRLLDKDEDGLPDPGHLEAIMERAERYVDSVLLRGRYTASELPATPGATSLTIKDVVEGVTWFYLHEATDTIKESIVAIFDRSNQQLWNVAKSTQNLGLPSDPVSDRSAPQILLSKATSDAKLSLEELEDW